jgi:hypothetical protein
VTVDYSYASVQVTPFPRDLFAALFLLTFFGPAFTELSVQGRSKCTKVR